MKTSNTKGTSGGNRRRDSLENIGSLRPIKITKSIEGIYRLKPKPNPPPKPDKPKK
jgi:hypothetical protein